MSRPTLAARFSKRGKGSSLAKVAGGITNSAGRPSGHSPTVMAAMFSSQRALRRRASPAASWRSTASSACMAARDPVWSRWMPPGRMGSWHMSGLAQATQLSFSPWRTRARPRPNSTATSERGRASASSSGSSERATSRSSSAGPVRPMRSSSTAARMARSKRRADHTGRSSCSSSARTAASSVSPRKRLSGTTSSAMAASASTMRRCPSPGASTADGAPTSAPVGGVAPSSPQPPSATGRSGAHYHEPGVRTDPGDRALAPQPIPPPGRAGPTMAAGARGAPTDPRTGGPFACRRAPCPPPCC